MGGFSEAMNKDRMAKMGQQAADLVGREKTPAEIAAIAEVNERENKKRAAEYVARQNAALEAKVANEKAEQDEVMEGARFREVEQAWEAKRTARDAERWKEIEKASDDVSSGSKQKKVA